MIDDHARLLLLKGIRPDDRRMFWLAPGGGVQGGESFEAAAIRELREETGLTIELGPWVWVRRHIYVWDGREFDQYERFFVGRTRETDVHPKNPDGYITGHRWWTLAEIAETDDDFAPRRLRELLPPLLWGEYPEEPLDCGV